MSHMLLFSNDAKRVVSFPSGPSGSSSGPSSRPTANEEAPKSGKGLSTGVYAGITIGVLGVVVVVTSIAWFGFRRCVRTRRRRRVTLDPQSDILAVELSRTLLVRPPGSVAVPTSAGTARSTTVGSHVSQPPLAWVAHEHQRLYPENPPTYYSTSERGD